MPGALAKDHKNVQSHNRIDLLHTGLLAFFLLACLSSYVLACMHKSGKFFSMTLKFSKNHIAHTLGHHRRVEQRQWEGMARCHVGTVTLRATHHLNHRNL
ncbi:hypothetical protein OTU49_007010 [Cherax quadricarinatus]|uniref:Uncharacterized protein n=1 Tax=Cherax quadricarinatus TaxID=27406 RepID=A0AAW0WWA4_CHEQU